jgi:hypothetical protein
MARSRARGAKKPDRGAGRQAKSRKKAAPAPAAAVEVVEEGGGSTFDDAICIVTALLIVTAILFADAFLGTYEKGVFF